MYLCDCMYIWFPKEVTSWQFKFCGLLQYVHVYCQQKLLIEIPNTLYSSLICFVLDTNHKQMACLYILSMYVLYMRITFVIQQLTYNVGTVQYPAVHVCEHFENMLLALTLFPQSMLSHLLFNMWVDVHDLNIKYYITVQVILAVWLVLAFDIYWTDARLMSSLQSFSFFVLKWRKWCHLWSISEQTHDNMESFC